MKYSFHSIVVLFFLFYRLYKAGTCAAIVGNGREGNRNNLYPHAASLAQPSGLTIAQEYNAAFFADSESSSIRQVHLEDGKVSTLCGADKNPQVNYMIQYNDYAFNE